MKLHWWWPQQWPQCKSAISKLNTAWQERINNAAIESGLVSTSLANQRYKLLAAIGGMSDFIYVPNRLRSQMIEGLNIMASYGCFLEIAIPTIANGIEYFTEFENLNALYIWDGDRDHVADLMVQTENIHVVHPAKLSDSSIRVFLERYLYGRYVVPV